MIEIRSDASYLHGLQAKAAAPGTSVHKQLATLNTLIGENDCQPGVFEHMDEIQTALLAWHGPQTCCPKLNHKALVYCSHGTVDSWYLVLEGCTLYSDHPPKALGIKHLSFSHIQEYNVAGHVPFPWCQYSAVLSSHIWIWLVILNAVTASLQLRIIFITVTDRVSTTAV